MKKLIFIFLILITSNTYSQQTEKYKKMISNLNPVDSIKIIKQNKKGRLKTEGKSITYKCNGKYYPFIKGKYLEYFNNGKLNQLGVYDEVGTFIYGRKYNRKGKLKSELIATKIETKTSNLCEFFNDYDYLVIHLTKNHYKYSKNLDLTYISKTVYFIDGKKIKGEKLNEPKK